MTPGGPVEGEPGVWWCITPRCGSRVPTRGVCCMLCFLYPQRWRDGTAGRLPLRHEKPRD